MLFQSVEVSVSFSVFWSDVAVMVMSQCVDIMMSWLLIVVTQAGE